MVRAPSAAVVEGRSFVSRDLRRTLPVLFAITIALLALVLPAGACSLVIAGLDGALGPDGSVVYLLPKPPEDPPSGIVRLKTYSVRGLPIRELSVDLGLSTYTAPRGMDAQGNVWLVVSCSTRVEHESCNSLLQVGPDGELKNKLPLDQDAPWPRFDLASGQFFSQRPDSTSPSAQALVIFPHGAEPGAPEARHLELPSDLWSSRDSARWALGRDHSAVAVEHGEWWTVVLFDPNGHPRARSRYAAAGPQQPASSSRVRLGDFGILAMADDGTIFASQYGLSADCSVYQPSSIAILDLAADQVRVVPTEGLVSALEVVGDQLVALQIDGRLLRFALDGTPTKTWTPPIDL